MSDILLNILTWGGLIGFVSLFIYLEGASMHEEEWKNSKVYKDLRETTLNREDKE